MQKYSDFKKEILKDKDVYSAYNKLEAEFTLVEALMQKRIEQGLTQKELAKRIGTRQSAISRFESGNYNPTLSFLRKISDALDLKLDIKISTS